MGLLEAIILAVFSASIPLILAASGELVVERAGVLNLGIEGMMIVGAACGFAGAYLTGSTFLGALFGIVGGVALSAVFALLAFQSTASRATRTLAPERRKWRAITKPSPPLLPGPQSTRVGCGP